MAFENLYNQFMKVESLQYMMIPNFGLFSSRAAQIYEAKTSNGIKRKGNDFINILNKKNQTKD